MSAARTRPKTAAAKRAYMRWWSAVAAAVRGAVFTALVERGEDGAPHGGGHRGDSAPDGEVD